MVTKDQAIGARQGTEFHYRGCTRSIGPRGGVTTKIETAIRNDCLALISFRSSPGGIDVVNDQFK